MDPGTGNKHGHRNENYNVSFVKAGYANIHDSRERTRLYGRERTRFASPLRLYITDYLSDLPWSLLPGLLYNSIQ